MKLALTHAALLVAALAFAYQTWTRDEAAIRSTGSVTLWDENPDNIVTITYGDRRKSLVVDRRSDELGSYLWGVRQSRPRAPGEAAASQPSGAIPDTIQFLVGQEEGNELLATLATPQAVRDLGIAVDTLKDDYGLAEDTALVSVQFGDRVRELVIGGSVFGSGDRYALDPTSGHVYVLPGAMMNLLAGADVTLTERRLHDFRPERVASLSLTTPTGQRSMVLTAAGVAGQYFWAAPETPNEPDQTFTNFMGRLDELWITDFRVDIDAATLASILRVDYLGPNGELMGFLELYKRTNPDPEAQGRSEYFLRTELTRVLTKTYEGMADVVERDVQELL